LAIRLLETSISRLRPSRFFDVQDVENEFAWAFDTLKHRFFDFTQVVFVAARRRKTDSQGFSTA
jgi:hypothetical protein